jgi:hypothetical protein
MARWGGGAPEWLKMITYTALQRPEAGYPPSRRPWVDGDEVGGQQRASC